MYPIVKKRKLSEKIFLMDVKAPMTARACLPGQFVIVAIDDKGERIPLTICDYDREAGTVTIVFQVVGASTWKMAGLEEGDGFFVFAGPLGKCSELTKEDLAGLKKKRILFAAGGVGAAPVYPQVKWLHDQGIEADCVIGARDSSLIILEEEMRQAGNVYITTDNGSRGFHGNINDCIRNLIEEEHKQYDLVLHPVSFQTIFGYSLASLILASCALNCQLIFTHSPLRLIVHARTCCLKLSKSGHGFPKAWRLMMPISISAMSSQLPCFGV